MIPRKRIDIGWADLSYGLLACAAPNDAALAAARVESAWHTARGNLACLSVRSGFDALLSVLQLPAGSEVLVSALTIGDMARVIEAHGLVVVPVDIDAQTLTVSRAALAQALSPRTRMLLVAHLYGSRAPMREVVDFCGKHKLLLLEDCAQAYTGDGWRGEVASDVCLFSFGPIKTATALGGAVLTFRDAALRDRVGAHLSQWPLQSRAVYFARLLKYAMLVLLAYRPCYSVFATLTAVLGIDRERMLTAAVRGFAGGEFFDKIRRRPSSPLLMLLRRRIAQGVQPSVAQRGARARQLIGLLAQTARPGALASWHSHWLFPITHTQTDALIAHLQARGFDAARGASSMGVVAATQGASHAGQAAPMVTHMVAHMVTHMVAQLCYLPAHEGMSARDSERLAAAVREFDAGDAKNAVLR